jgi:transposase
LNSSGLVLRQYFVACSAKPSLIQAMMARKERRTAKQMHADLVQLGFDGSYERVASFIREWKGERQRATQTTGRGTFVPLVFQPGDAFQFDWSEDWAYVGGERIKLQVAHIKLSYSRAFLVRAYLLQTHDPLVPFPTEMHCRAMDAV